MHPCPVKEETMSKTRVAPACPTLGATYGEDEPPCAARPHRGRSRGHARDVRDVRRREGLPLRPGRRWRNGDPRGSWRSTGLDRHGLVVAADRRVGGDPVAEKADMGNVFLVPLDGEVGCRLSGVMRGARRSRSSGGSSKSSHTARPPRLGCVLIADDNLADREMYASYFAAQGLRVLVAGDGVNAVHIAQGMRPDVLVMDLSLPSLDGWEATRRLKHDARTAHIPILACTGHATDRKSVV